MASVEGQAGRARISASRRAFDFAQSLLSTNGLGMVAYAQLRAFATELW